MTSPRSLFVLALLGTGAALAGGVACSRMVALLSSRFVLFAYRKRLISGGRAFGTHADVQRVIPVGERILLSLLERRRCAWWCGQVTRVQARVCQSIGLRPSMVRLGDSKELLERSDEVSGLFTIGLCGSAALGAAVYARNVNAIALATLAVFVCAPTLFRRVNATREKKRRERYERLLPAMIQLIVLSVQAGATFDAALAAYCQTYQDALARRAKQAYDLYISQVTSRNDALDAFARDIDSELFYRFVATVKRALYLGSPLSAALESQLHDIREYRKERIKEEIAKKPVQILLPLGLCILPGMLIILLGPVLMEVMRGINLH